MPFALRRARLGDLAKVARLEARVWKELAASYLELRRRFLLFPQGFQVIEFYPEIVAFCTALRTDRDARQAESLEDFPARHLPRGRILVLLGLTVNPIFRGRGLASRLVAREVEVARRQGCSRIQVIANRNSQGLFRRAGFQVCAPLPALFTDYPALMPDPVLMEYRC